MKTKFLLLAIFAFSNLWLSLKTFADQQNSEQRTSEDVVSPIRKINQPPHRDIHRDEPIANSDSEDRIRTIDGSNNNRREPTMGAAFTPLVRLFPADYTDGLSEMPGNDRLSPRAISNIVAIQSENRLNTRNASDFLWQWGQFLDHDIDLTDGADPVEQAYIEVPQDDGFFISGYTMQFNRSLYDNQSGVTNPRQQLNEITAWIDASNVYGSEHERAEALRMLDGSGKLKTSAGNLLPFNVDGLANAGGNSESLFLAGDVRANEQVGLTVMHTLFVREHNRLADDIAQNNPSWTGDQIYEKARQLVGAQMQVITYQEFLPALLGPKALRPYRGYRADVNAGIMNSFSTAAYRFGHSALSPTLLRLDQDNQVIPAGNLALRNAFFSPSQLQADGGIAPLLRGLAKQRCQRIDSHIIDDVRNFLFGTPPTTGFDLAAINIQRGRDHGLPTYNEARRQLGLRPARSFRDVSSNLEIQARLASAYDSVDDIDLWVGGLSEDPLPEAHLGEVFFHIVRDQFEALRDGDRFWYSLTLSSNDRERVESTRLSDIIRRNTSIGEELQNNVFLVSNEDPRKKRSDR